MTAFARVLTGLGRPKDWLSPLLLVQLAVVFACVLALRMQWHTPKDLIAAIDHGDTAFGDFVFHYYPTARDSIREGAPAGGFFYPAGFAVFLAPLGRLELDPAMTIWGAILVLAVLVIATYVVRAAANGKPALAAVGTALVVTCVPVLHDFKWGQVSVLIVAIGGAAFVLHARGKENLAAALLGIVAAIKGYPLVFLGWFVLKGDFKFVAKACVACFVTIVLLPAIVMGPTHALFFQKIATNSVLGASDGVLYDFNSQYAPAVLARFHGGWGVAPRSVTHAGEIGARAALLVIALLLLVLARSRSRRLREVRDLWAFVLLASTVPFWLHTSWTHYFVQLPLAQILLAAILVERRRPRDIAVLVLLVAPSVFLSNVLGLRATDGWLPYAESGSPFFANALVLLASAFVIVDAHVLDRERVVAEGERQS